MNQPTLSDLKNFARLAGEILHAGYGESLEIDHKGVINLVTEMDRRSEALLLDCIRKQFHGHRIIAEESGRTEGDVRYQWYIDPLDGTVNYVHGIPIFAVSIAFAEMGEVNLGVIYDPMHDECFSAERGRGAWLNGKKIQVSKTKELGQSLLVTGFPYDVWSNPVNNLDHYADFTLGSLGVRRLGSAALDLAYVATGRFDGFWEISIYPWDIAAGGLIVQEAGGVVTNKYGEADILSPPCSILASNPQIHPQMLQILGPNQ